MIEELENEIKRLQGDISRVTETINSGNVFLLKAEATIQAYAGIIEKLKKDQSDESNDDTPDSRD